MFNKVVFDFDGTLADTFDQIIALTKELRPDLSEKEISLFKEFGASEAAKRLKLSLGEIFKVWTAARKNQLKIIEAAKEYVGIKELIAELKDEGVEVGILTSNSKENVEKWLTKKEIEVDWVKSGLTLFGKEKAISMVKSKDMIYVGDEVRDIEACRKVGVKIVAVTWGFNNKKALVNAGADYVVDKVTELRKLLLSLSQ